MVKKWNYPNSDVLHIHPFDPFIPENTKKLILGTFPGREYTCKSKFENSKNWFYQTSGNQFWQLIEYSLDLPSNSLNSKEDKQKILQEKGLGISDIIESGYRIRNTNEDSNIHVSQIRDLEVLLEIGKNIQLIILTSISMYKEFFCPAYIQNNPSFRLVSHETKSLSHNILNHFYHYDLRGRRIIVVPIHSPAREIPVFELKKELYKAVINSNFYHKSD